MAASAPFQNRELNGELLVDELKDLRRAQVLQEDLNECVASLRGLSGSLAPDAVRQLRALAAGRFAKRPGLASLLIGWSTKLKNELDVSLFIGHIQQLALTASVVDALRLASARLPKARR